MSHTSVILVVYVRMAYIYLVAVIPLNLSLIHHVNIIMLAVCVVQTAVHACLSMITSTSHPYPGPSNTGTVSDLGTDGAQVRWCPGRL